MIKYGKRNTRGLSKKIVNNSREAPGEMILRKLSGVGVQFPPLAHGYRRHGK